MIPAASCSCQQIRSYTQNCSPPPICGFFQPSFPSTGLFLLHLFTERYSVPGVDRLQHTGTLLAKTDSHNSNYVSHSCISVSFEWTQY